MKPKKPTIEHLAAYLPYGLRVLRPDGITILKIYGITEDRIIFSEPDKNGWTYGNIHKSTKPILRPLSDLTKEIEHNGERFTPIDFFEIGDDYNESVDYGSGNIKLIGLLKDMVKYNFIDLPHMQYGVVLKLIEWKFDVFKLIDAGLAIDINSLEENK